MSRQMQQYSFHKQTYSPFEICLYRQYTWKWWPAKWKVWWVTCLSTVSEQTKCLTMSLSFSSISVSVKFLLLFFRTRSQYRASWNPKGHFHFNMGRVLKKSYYMQKLLGSDWLRDTALTWLKFSAILMCNHVRTSCPNNTFHEWKLYWKHKFIRHWRKNKHVDYLYYEEKTQRSNNSYWRKNLNKNQMTLISCRRRN